MKLQPNFSWQKYEGKPEDQKQQFQYQLQTQHSLVANAVNATINDLSYYTKERPTGFAWINGQQLYTKTLTGTIVGTSTNATPHGIVGLNQLVSLTGSAQDAVPMAVSGLPLPYLDTTTLANGLGLSMDTTNVYVTAANATWDGYLFAVTITYTKT